MKRIVPITVVALASLALGLAGSARAAERTLMGRIAHNRAQQSSWHANYYAPEWGMPLALVVPPTVQSQTNWGWGVGNTRVTGIPHQFERGYPGPGYYDRGMFRPTPPWPSDTTQFGVYYIRGPW